MMFRNPEHIARMNAQYRATAPSYIEEYRDRHDQIRQPSDPETFDEFKVRFLSREHNMTGLHAIPTMLQSRRVLGEIQSFHFWTATLSDFASPTSKLGQLQAMLQRPEGATIAQLSKALDWQAHSVRGAMSGSLKKKQGLKITASKEEGADRVYRIAG
jgi:hypothetical protein